MASTLKIWRRLSAWPCGKWLFSRIVCWKAPYFGSIRPRIVELLPGYGAVEIKKRRSVLNHIGTVHAIAMCNMAELAAGTMTDATIPVTHRWIPKGMTVEYLGKAQTDLRAVAVIDPMPEFGPAMDLPVAVSVTDEAGQLVFSAQITMWVSPKKRFGA
ncbi:MAG: hotdog fold domain-containing protein [Gammaproteobacteria bacterium]